MISTVTRVGLSTGLRRQLLVSPASRNALRSVILSRHVQTESLPPSASTEILNEQRLKRPSSPHFTIYQPQLTWLGSIAHRGTGVALSALLYGFSISYLFVPEFFSSAHIIEMAAALPVALKISAKAALAAPFSFHFLNGLRHLAWDLGYFLTVKGAYRSGYAVLAGTAIATGAFVGLGM